MRLRTMTPRLKVYLFVALDWIVTALVYALMFWCVWLVFREIARPS